MNILAIESSAKAASVALCRDEFLVAESYQNSGFTHSRTLMPLCRGMLESCEVSLSHIDLIAVAHGPGSFTGLRIGLSTAKGLAWGEEKACLGVSTLEAMAWNLLGTAGVICCAMDARRQQVYNALFRMGEHRPERLTEDRAIALEELFQDERMNGAMLVGDGAELCKRFAQDAGVPVRLAPPNLRHQHAYGVARCALERWNAGERGSGAELAANYLRLSQAERERLEREAKQHPSLQ
jgi:tRNA threonylcarbamoyladenosine biosynthesis protein TsaB